jgi:hypothetical protein
MKESGKTLQEMQEQIEHLSDPRRDGETCGNVWQEGIQSSIMTSPLFLRSLQEWIAMHPR